MSIFDDLTGLKNAGAESVPAPKPTAAAPASSEADLEKYRVTDHASKRALVADVAPAVPVPVLPLPAGATEAFTRDGVFLGVLKADGAFVRKTSEHENDPLVGLSAEDTRPRDENEEASISAAPRTAGRVKFLWETYERFDPDPNPATNPRLQKRLANDLARASAAHAANAKPFDPESSRGAQEIKNWLA